MNKTLLSWIFVVLVIGGVVGVYFVFNGQSDGVDSESLDVFAACLTEKGVKMYGTYWCPHCQNQKKLFGDSFRLVDYVECTEETALCESANIKGVPTWIFSNGERIEGEASFAALAEKSGCDLPLAQ